MTDAAAAADRDWMRLALIEARTAAALGEVPVGALLVSAEGRMLARAGNACISACDPTAHAEMLVLRQAAQQCRNYRLPGTTLYVTLEPCPMCAAALVQARVARLVFGALDPKAGAVVSRYRIGSDGLLNHSFVLQGGVLAEECGEMLRSFFRSRRC
ncbi:MAG: tRNA-specific adenosine deaminase [Desulfobulbaceae bacterium A2]|nr:MAG: tRNA-specific adenosine deaminase [Desulfobulbaceae bacterium A2]